MPNFCKNSNVLMLIVFVVLAALLIELVENTDVSIDGLALKVSYLLWISLICAGFLCFFSRFLVAKRETSYSIFQWVFLFLGCLVLFCTMELIVQSHFYNAIDWNRFVRFLLIATIMLFIAFRMFSLFDVFRIRAQAETNSRIEALQARIEPHFLFNSLNTIAELTHQDPKQAEEAIQSLSSLIRNSLNDESFIHSLEDEIQFCKQYLQLEKWRLGERLKVVWNVQVADPGQIMIPKVLIQPLIENAIIHGIAPNVKGGKLAIKMSKRKNMLKVIVQNKWHENNEEGNAKEAEGLGIALNNIKERLFVLYDDNHKYKVKRSNGLFTVSIELPDKI